MSQALRRGDETKISSGVSQSHRGDELFEIVQYTVYQIFLAENFGKSDKMYSSVYSLGTYRRHQLVFWHGTWSKTWEKET